MFNQSCLLVLVVFWLPYSRLKFNFDFELNIKMDNFFELLPNEITWDILDYLTNPSDLFKVSQLPGLANCLGWEFWQKKAFQIWKVPEWYFNLPVQQKREISGDNRFIEVATQFEIIPESIARIEGGKVKGVLPHSYAKFLAEYRGNLQMVGELNLKKKEIIHHSQLNQFGLAPIINMEILGRVSEKEFLKDAQEITTLIEEGRTQEIEEEYLWRKPFQTMASFAVLGDGKTCNWINGRFGFATSKQQLAVTYFSMLSNNFSLFEELFSDSKLSKVEKQTLLGKAYYLAKEPHIAFLESQGVQIATDEKIHQLDKGFVSIPRPVETYKILKELLSDKSFNRKGIFCDDLVQQVDFFLLLNNHQSSDKLLRTMESSIQWTNVSVGSVRHFISVLKDEGKIQPSEPFFLFSECEIKQAIFEEFGVEVSTATQSFPLPEYLLSRVNLDFF